MRRPADVSPRHALPLLLAAALLAGGMAPLAACEGGTASGGDAAAAEAGALAAAWGADGAVLLSDGRSLVPAGLALPTALDPRAGLVARSRATAETVLDGRFVVPVARSRDRHGRLIGDARLLPEPEDGGRAGRSLAQALVSAGAGFADPQAAPACAAALLAAEAEARQARRGIFADPAAVLPALDQDRLGRRAGLFTLAEGRVRAAGATRDKVFLNFGSRWREDFTIVLPAGDFATILGDGLDPAMLRGTLVSVRGVVRMDGGPAIFVRGKDEIAILDGPTPDSAKEGEAR